MSEMRAFEQLKVAVCGASADVAATVDALRAAGTGRSVQAEIIAAEVPAEGADKRSFLEMLSGARLAVVRADGTGGWSADLRQLCLQAVRLTGSAPILVASQDASGETVRSGWKELSGLLGLPSGSDRVIPAGDGLALCEAVGASLQPIASALTAPGVARLAIDAPADPEAPTVTIGGSLLSGTFAPGLKVVLLPSAQSATVVSSTDAADGRAAVTLDAAVVVGADSVLAAADHRPEQADQVVAHVVWIGRKPMLPGRTYNVRLAGRTSTAQISTLKHKVDAATLNPIAARRLEQGSVGLCNVSFADPLVFDTEGSVGPQRLPSERFVLEDRIDGGLVGVGDIVFTLRRATNIHWQALAVDKGARATLKQQRPGCLWFTGLSGSGKSTVASLLEKRLNALGRHTYTLDGDNVRHGLNRDLGFTDADRVENIRRVGEVSKLMVDAGLIVMVSFISPFRAERRMARGLFPSGEFLEIFVDTPISVCEQRDPKGLYKKARSGQLKNFTGIDSPYEPPEHAEIYLEGGTATPEELVERVLSDLMRRGMV